MLRDVFYYGNKPNVHPRERHAPNLEAARYLSTTEHFWIINEFCDYTNFDWDFDFDTLPDEDVWTEKHNNVWPSQHQQDSGTWLCNKTYTDIIFYRKDVDFVKRKNIKTEHWEILHPIDESKFDFSWHPDPTEPPYIYRWGCRYFPPTHEPVVQYVMPGATTFKYFDTVVELVPRWDRWKILHDIEMNSFDFCWAPDPTSPPYIYTFGNQHHDAIKMPTLEYHMPDSEERKYVKAQAYTATIKQHPERFEHFEDSHGIDYSWVPDPDSGPYIYVWGNQWNQPEDKISIQYAVQGATTYKYMSERAIRRPCMDNWEIPEGIDVTKFDFSWEPSPAEPPFIYQFGTQWQKTGGPRYIVKGATEIKYVDVTKAKAKPKPVRTNWELPTDTLIDTESFDYSWHPDDTDPPYIYQFGTQWQKTGGPRYVVQGATEIKYIDATKAKALPNVTNWEVDNGVPLDLNIFDFSWHPDNTETPFIYQFGTQWQKTGGPRYVVQGATEVSYVDIQKAVATPTTECWEFDNSVNIDKDRFDFSWHPDTTDTKYIYQFGTQHQKTGGPRYVMQGATEIKYVDQQRATTLEDRSKFEVLTDYVLEFDYSWHPDTSEQPYIYVFGNQHHIAEKMNTVRYIMQGATELKYINDHKATIIPNKSRFKIYTLIDETKFDFSWIPDPNDPPYVYVWGNKHVPGEISPTIEFVSKDINKLDGSSGRKFIHNEVELLVEWDRWNIIDQIDRNKFDFTWRPDPTAPPYIYAWGSKHVDPQTSPAIEYKVPEATEYKFMTDTVVDVLPRFENWFEYEKIDRSKFDYTWRPNPKEPPYIYAWGSKHVLNYVGSVIEYRVPGATDYKYMSNDVETLPNKERWKILQPVDEQAFDFSWHPSRTDPPYIYVWGNKYVPGELQSTLEYRVQGATEYKYMIDPAPVLPQAERWTIVQEIDKNKFDLTWRPDPREPPYIYVWGNKYIPGEKKPTLTYHMPGATEYKYLGDVDVVPEFDKWQIHLPVDLSKFDFCWRPDPNEPPYIYVWGNKYVSPELRPTIEYYCEGATERKYMYDTVELVPEWNRWEIIQKPINFDFTWIPDPREPPYIYVWGNKYIPGEKRPTLRYHVQGATEYKYVSNDLEVEPEWDKWQIHTPVDKTKFDFSWRPDPIEPPYIYVWGNKYVPAELRPTLEYHCEGATQRKYMSELVELAPQWDRWEIIQQPSDFDFTWIPDPREPPYIYIWGNKWISGEKKPTIRYIVPGATEYKYVNNEINVQPEWDKWKILIPVDKDSFDFSWRPDPSEPPFVYVWGNQSNPAEVEPTLEYHCEDAYDQRKYMHDQVAKTLPIDKNWEIVIPVDEFDYSWRPHPGSPPYIYVFGNKWNEAATEPTIRYHVQGATEYKYMEFPLASPRAEMKYWSISNNDDLETFDFSWRPNPFSPPQIYQWEDNGPRYTVPGATEVVYMKRDSTISKTKVQIARYYITTTLEDLIKEHNDEVFWALNPDINYDNFNFDWKPNERNFRHINVFGNEYAKDTQTYYINGPMYNLGHREYNYVEDQKVEVANTKLSMFYIDRGNIDSNRRYDELKKRFPNIVKTRYLNSWVDTINRCIRKSETGLFWVLNSEYDYVDFKFNFYPSPWQLKMVHVFGTQWSHWGHTYLINGESFIEDTKYVKIIEHLNCLNFVKGQRAKATDCLYDIYLIDHGNFETSYIESELRNKYDKNKITVVSHNQNYLETFKTIIDSVENKRENYIWICNSVCGYDDFDFSYICDPFAREQLHVFPSDRQKYGDTFLVNVEKLREQYDNMRSLDDYDQINFNQHQRTNRLEAPEIVVEDDTHTEIIHKIDFEFPYVILKTRDNNDLRVKDEEPMSLWSNRSKTVTVTTTGATRIIVPKEVKKYIKDEYYDYPFISENIKKSSKPLDIVFLSNGETNAEENYQHLLEVTKGLPNRVVRVDGVNGRVAAYHAAALASNTNWMFTVFAKLKVDKDFDWGWQPDRLRKPKHYIFHALNPVNRLTYGHQAMIAYNKKLTLANSGRGLDFTLDDLHDTVPILSGVAEFNTDSYSTWRTAFREVIKLKSDYEAVSAERLKVWLSEAEGNYAQDCLRGARDAINYYNEVNGDIDQLKQSYEWAWLKDFYNRKYK